MKRSEIIKVIEESFEKIAGYLNDSLSDFDINSISNFRKEVRKLKVFLHLVEMESEDGLSGGIPKQMRRIYGCMGIILNIQQQLKRVRQFTKVYPEIVLDNYLKMLEYEMKDRKIMGRRVTDHYSFHGDKKIILSFLPEELTTKSIFRFIHYTIFEIQLLSHFDTDTSLDNARKLTEDMLYNFPFIRSHLTDRLLNLLNKETMEEFIRLSNEYQEGREALHHLQSHLSENPGDQEMQALKMMESEWAQELDIIRIRLVAKLNSMEILNYNLNEFAPV